MKTIRLSVLMVFFGGVLSHQTLTAQYKIQASVSSMMDDNVNNNALDLSSFVSSLDLNAGYMWNTDRTAVKVFYDGAFSYYRALAERNHHAHSANIEYAKTYGEESQHALDIGAGYGINLNRDVYTIYDHAQFTGFFNYKYSLSDRLLNRSGYTFRAVRFRSIPDFNYTEHVFFMQAAMAVSPTTTVILQSDLGMKYYSSPVTDSGGVKQNSSSLLPHVTQFIGMARIGQRITDATGISLTTRYQWNLQKETHYFNSEYGFISDDELFDDHYGYEGWHTSLTATQLISESVTLKLTGGLQNKRYSSLPAYDFLGNILAGRRKDTRSYINVLLQKHFEDSGFSLRAMADFIRNSSNDPFYNYRNNALTVEVVIPF